MWVVQTGKDKSAYSNRYVVETESAALFWYFGINTHSGYKKRLVSPDGTIVKRYIS